MQPNNLTALDFEDIKASIKSYLRSRNEFTDYDFEGSSLSYLIDTLAYNSYYTAFNANMAMNEAFLPSATIRDNVVNVAKLLNYVPRSITSSRACLKLDVQTTQTAGAYPSSITLKKGAIASGGNYIFNILEDITTTVSPSTGIGTFDNVMIMEGSIVTFQYIVNTFATQVYKVPSEDADISTLSVRVKPNESSTTSDLYSLTDTITDLTATTRAYFLSEGEDMRYEVKFGDDTAGRALKDGEVVLLEYLVTSGTEANEITTFSFIGQITDNIGGAYSGTSVTLSMKEKSQLGAAAETLESIKYNAPRYYSAQYRAVTAQDYALIAKKVYSNADSVVAYGGDSLNPPIYGKVFIAIQTKTGSLLNDATKKSISADLRKYAMASIDPVVIDPEQMYLYLKVFAQYDPGTASNTSDIKTNIQNGINDWATQTQINNFNSTFRAQAFEKAVTLSDNSLSDVSLQLSILKYIYPNTNQTNTYCIATGADLYDSAPSNSDGTTCKKEPILLSGPFRTADRPGIDQQFEDDGFGNLRTFYNTGNKKVYTNNAAGTVNYATGQICFGPVNIIGSGVNTPPTGSITITDSTTGAGSVTNADLLPTGLQIPVLFIPANVASIPAATPGTIINIINPEVTVVPVGTIPPPTIPLNSLTPSVFNTVPTTITVADISNAGDLTSSSCF
ncbi:baseplate wedge subunit [Cyanophage S-TIM4]|uniref:Baseplate wedge n=2 Tax=Thaumasvirus stim4 TaxID=2734148 RepID=A0A345AWF3_9CAUD|nr:baseplate wedge subunit [Prochlorococcus phage P-RSM4]YP_009806357.1 baseplate wedge subunit [Cyanophage S-TIM4]ADO98489.1 baseplate wedge [Prochlorococcus phage P-RSM4]AXF41236.1 baseplate wedge [Cyanophage S-TIM4]|tara:strand:+ start:1124 stop:3151 length:2028 start_codon:yes stop_codon:yes gene_type:complete